MDQSSRNPQLGETGKNGTNDSDDQAQISPKSMESYKKMKDHIEKLVDDEEPDDQNSLVGQVVGLSLDSAPLVGLDSESKQQQFFAGQGFAPSDFPSGTPFFPNYNADNQERLQGLAKPVGEFAQAVGSKPASYYSRQSSDGADNIRGDLSEQAVLGGALSVNLEDNYSQGDSKSDYHGSVQKFGHLFQSPDFRGPQVRQNFLGGGEEGYFNTAIWEGYHHQPSKGGFRASSFDKANGTGGHGTQHHQHEELETHSAVSSGNQSAFSEGDASNQIYQHSGLNGNAQHFYPNQQFVGIQQYNGQGYYPQQMIYAQNNLGYQNMAAIDQSSIMGFGGDIQISDQDVSLKNMIGVSPRRGSGEFKPTSKQPNSQSQHVNAQNHSVYKTPSPYRNNEQFNGNYNQRNSRMAPQMQEQMMRQGYNFQNQRFVNQQPPHMGHFYPSNRGDHAHNIGMNAPPLTRGLIFPSQEQHFISGGPMVAIQPNMHGFQAFNAPMHGGQIHVQAPLKANFKSGQTGSQEREANYQPPNFVPNHHMQGHPRSGFATPTHPFNDCMSASSHNSADGNSQDQTLFQVMKLYDECSNPVAKLDLLKGQVHKLALTQKGSRFLQKQVQKASANTVQFFLEEIGPHLADLMVDNYGNYFCQNLLQSCSGSQRLSILKGIGENFIPICCDKKGTHTIQKMLELVNLQDEEDFIRSALKGRIIELSKNGQGTHVVQKVLGSFSEQRRIFIFEEVFEQFIELAKDSNGLCVVKKIVQITKIPEQVRLLMNKIQDNAIDLAQDAFGNYAITEVINRWDAQTCLPVFKALKERIGQLSSQKYSSPVIEKCFEKADDKMQSALIDELAKSDRLSSLIRNQYGNFVVQRALKLAQGSDRDQLTFYIQKCIPDITDRKIKEKWEKIIFDAQHGTNTAAADNTSQGSGHGGRRANSSDAAQ